MAFILVYSKTTGRQQSIPEGWFGHPVLGRDFRKTPPPDAAEGKTRGSATAGSDSRSTADTKEKK